MAEKSSAEERAHRKASLADSVQASRAAAKEVTKDAAGLSRQAAILRAKAAEVRSEAQEVRAQARRAPSLPTAALPAAALPAAALPAAALLTIPEAACRLHVAQRSLRDVLAEPDWQVRLVEKTRKVGIYYKFIPLVSPELMTDLVARFALNTPRKPKNKPGK